MNQRMLAISLICAALYGQGDRELPISELKPTLPIDARGVNGQSKTQQTDSKPIQDEQSEHDLKKRRSKSESPKKTVSWGYFERKEEKIMPPMDMDRSSPRKREIPRIGQARHKEIGTQTQDQTVTTESGMMTENMPEKIDSSMITEANEAETQTLKVVKNKSVLTKKRINTQSEPAEDAKQEKETKVETIIYDIELSDAQYDPSHNNDKKSTKKKASKKRKTRFVLEEEEQEIIDEIEDLEDLEEAENNSGALEEE